MVVGAGAVAYTGLVTDTITTDTPLHIIPGSAVEQDIANAIRTSLVHGGWVTTILQATDAHRAALARECEDDSRGVYLGVDINGKTWRVCAP